MSQFGDRLRELRLKEALTQKELGRLFRLSESAIGMYERNQREPSLDLVTQFADFFNVSTGFLLSHESPVNGVHEHRSAYSPSLEYGVLRYDGQLERLTKDEATYLIDALSAYRTKHNRPDSH